jgi:hypothetical protein
MAGRLERRQPYAAEFDGLAIVEGMEGVLGAGGSSQVDSGARPVAQLKMARQKVSMEMGQKYVCNTEPVFRRIRQVTIYVALGVDNGGNAGGFVADEVRGVGEAIQVELLKNH